MNRKTIMSVPVACFWSVIAVCVLGIVIGSFRDFDINVALACVYVLIYGYNRIHMTSHFLSDVCFGTLITYLIYSLISTAFLRGCKE